MRVLRPQHCPRVSALEGEVGVSSSHAPKHVLRLRKGAERFRDMTTAVKIGCNGIERQGTCRQRKVQRPRAGAACVGAMPHSLLRHRTCCRGRRAGPVSRLQTGFLWDPSLHLLQNTGPETLTEGVRTGMLPRGAHGERCGSVRPRAPSTGSHSTEGLRGEPCAHPREGLSVAGVTVRLCAEATGAGPTVGSGALLQPGLPEDLVHPLPMAHHQHASPHDGGLRWRKEREVLVSSRHGHRNVRQ